MNNSFPAHVWNLLQERYFLSGKTFENYYGKEGIEDWKMLCNRVAMVVSNGNQAKTDKYFDLLYNKKFLPNSPTLFGAGLKDLCLSACFVIPVEDSIEGWSESFRIAMKVQTAGGGCGFPLHKLRPSGMEIANKRAKAAGPIEFMKCWNQISKSFSQAVRNGANMGYLLCSHPNIEEFIVCKDKDGDLCHFNISVGITNEFMECVKEDKPFNLTWKNKIIKTVNAKELWNTICERAWKTGEPGILFHDNMQQGHLYPEDGDLYVNPCLHGDTKIMTEFGYIPIRILMKIIETEQVKCYDGEKWQKITKIWSNGRKKCIQLYFNNSMVQPLICTEDHKLLLANGEWCEAKDCLKKTLYNGNNGFPIYCHYIDYNTGTYEVFDFTQPETQKAVIWGGITVHNCAEFTGTEGTSCNLGSVNLSYFVEQDKFNYDLFLETIDTAYDFLDDLIDVNHYPDPVIDKRTKQYRQIGLGMMGIADVFIKLNMKYGSEMSCNFFVELMAKFRTKVQEKNIQLAKEKGAYPKCTESIPKRNYKCMTCAPTGSISQIAGCSQGIEPVFAFKFNRIIAGKLVESIDYPVKSENAYVNVTTNDVTPEEHLKITAIAQKYIDMSISKTINFKKEATVEDIKKTYQLAFEYGLKGCTVYRDGSRQNQTIQTESSYSVNADGEFKRCLTMEGKTFKDKIGCGNLYITINWDENKKIKELFLMPGKHGGCNANTEGLSRVLSVALQHGVEIEDLVKQLKGIKCPSCMYGKIKKDIRSLSCPDSVARALNDVLNEHCKKKEIKANSENSCPVCSNSLQTVGSCKQCVNCGWKKCG
jgi:ribonucleotide reductase alpha subunit